MTLPHDATHDSFVRALLDRWFGIRRAHSTVGMEITAGLTTFLTMVYIAAVNPTILGEAGVPKGAAFTATCLAAALGSILMGFFGRLPVGLAPGMAVNTYFASYVCGQLGYSWQTGLGAIFLSGIMFLILTWTGVRERLILGIPESMKHATAAGIGVFIAFIALKSAGIVVADPNTLVRLDHGLGRSTLVTFFGLIVSGTLLARRVRGALLIGIMLSTMLAVVLGVAKPPEGLVSMPPSLAPTFLAMDVAGAIELGFLHLLFTFVFVDLFDTIATLLGIAEQGGLLVQDEQGRTTLPRATYALTADAVATVVGAMLGTSTTTSYIESTAGVAEGGRTGLVAVVVGMGFLLLLFVSPLVMIIPSEATAPALILVVGFLLSNLRKLDYDDFTELIPAIMAFLVIPLTLSISDGLAVGFMTYALLKILSGRYREVTVSMYVLATLFSARILLNLRP